MVLLSVENCPSSLPQLGWSAYELAAVLVVGAGVGGISVARGLLRDGHDVTVFEQRPDMRPGGGAVTIWPNGSTVLEQLGVDMDGAGQLLSTVRIATSTGRPLVNIAVNTIVDRLGGPVRMVPRRVLLDRLLEGFPGRPHQCNSRVAAAFNTPDGVRVEFEDGSCADGDLSDRCGWSALEDPTYRRCETRGVDRLVHAGRDWSPFPTSPKRMSQCRSSASTETLACGPPVAPICSGGSTCGGRPTSSDRNVRSR